MIASVDMANTFLETVAKKKKLKLVSKLQAIDQQ